MLRLTGIVGHASDLDIADKLHDLGHHGQVESVVLSRADTQRHRLRVRTDRGTECAVALPRTEHLSQGAVLLLEDDRQTGNKLTLTHPALTRGHCNRQRSLLFAIAHHLSIRWMPAPARRLTDALLCHAIFAGQ